MKMVVREIEKLKDDHALTLAVVKRLAYPKIDDNDSQYLEIENEWMKYKANDLALELASRID